MPDKTYEPKFTCGDPAWFLRFGWPNEWIRVRVKGAHGVFYEPSYVVTDGRNDHYAPLERLRPVSAVELLGEIA